MQMLQIIDQGLDVDPRGKCWHRQSNKWSLKSEKRRPFTDSPKDKEGQTNY